MFQMARKMHLSAKSDECKYEREPDDDGLADRARCADIVAALDGHQVPDTLM
jgi:hypothetical protein